MESTQSAGQGLDSSISHLEHQASQPFGASLVTSLPVLSSAPPITEMCSEHCTCSFRLLSTELPLYDLDTQIEGCGCTAPLGVQQTLGW